MWDWLSCPASREGFIVEVVILAALAAVKVIVPLAVHFVDTAGSTAATFHVPTVLAIVAL